MVGQESAANINTKNKLVAPPRLELGTQGSSGLCSTN